MPPRRKNKESSKIIVKTLVVGQLSTNCYLIIDPKTDRCIVIDPGDDASYISSVILENNYKLEAIIATHGHFDHILGVREIQDNFNCSFYCHEKDKFLIDSMVKRATKWLGRKIVEKPPETKYLSQLPGIDFFGFKLKIIFTPGHTPGGICLYFYKDNILFSGDLLFSDGYIGRTDFSYSNKADIKKSLKKILSLPEDTVIFPGHDAKTTIREEKLTIEV